MFTTFKPLEDALHICYFNSKHDIELSHVKADELLKQIAIAASKQSLTESEVSILIEIYEQVNKNY